jgi:hypothetical protein
MYEFYEAMAKKFETTKIEELWEQEYAEELKKA